MAKKQTRADRKASAPKAAAPKAARASRQKAPKVVRPFSVEGLSEGVPKPEAKAAPKPMSGAVQGMKMKLSSPPSVGYGETARKAARKGLPKPATKAAPPPAAPKLPRSAVRPMKAGSGVMAEPLKAETLRNAPRTTRKYPAPKASAKSAAAPAPKPAAPAPKSAAKAPKFSARTPKGLAPNQSDIPTRLTKKGQQAQMRNTALRGAAASTPNAPIKSAVKPGMMSRIGDVAGKIGKAAGTIGRGALKGAAKGARMGGDGRTRAVLTTGLGLLGAAQAASSLYDGLRPYNNSAAPKSSPTPSPKAAPKAAPSSAPARKPPAPASSRTPSPRPTPFASSDAKRRQDEFLKRYEAKGFSPTQQEREAYESIKFARSEEGRKKNLVGIGIMGRGPAKKPGSKKL